MTKLKSFSQKKGFTLIELLVVIGILGILAAGLLAAIDPLEQLKKGRDQQKRSTTTELFNAFTRYYAVNGVMPSSTAVAATLVQGATNSIITTLIGVGELKTTFMKGIPAGTANAILFTINATSAAVCFDPESKSISGDPTTIFDSVALPPGTGTTCGVTTTCYFCVQ